jgi:hypothetical protein
MHRYTIDPGQDELVLLRGSEEDGLKEAIRLRDEGPNIKSHRKYAFLYEAYEPKCWWFEIFECVRRLSLTAGVIMLKPGSVIQIVISMLLCLLSMRIYAGASPYISDRDDILAEVRSTQPLR